MGKQKREQVLDFELDPFRIPDDLDDIDLDSYELAEDFYSTERKGHFDSEERFNTRRKNDHRKATKAGHSRFHDWDDFDN